MPWPDTRVATRVEAAKHFSSYSSCRRPCRPVQNPQALAAVRATNNDATLADRDWRANTIVPNRRDFRFPWHPRRAVVVVVVVDAVSLVE